MAGGPAHAPRHIVVINDSEEIVELFRDILEGLGHRVTAGTYSPDDLATVADARPDLVILDVLTGPTEERGWALLQKLRMSRATEDVPILLCTAATNWVREQEGWLAVNAVKIVPKPFRVEDLERAVEKVFSLSGMADKRRQQSSE